MQVTYNLEKKPWNKPKCVSVSGGEDKEGVCGDWSETQLITMTTVTVPQ